ncbi:MAG: universal stress protein [Hyphomonadaceae bacterium]|nr:universal stress protein [Hyphomonadaceae bacterium]
MSFKDILAIVVSGRDVGALNTAEALAAQQGGAATAVLLEVQPDPVSGFDVYVMSEVWAEAVKRAREGYAKEKAKLAARLNQSAQPMRLRSVEIPQALAGPRAAVEARYADLAIMDGPDDALRRTVFEAVLFGAGRPVLLAPAEWPGACGRNVVIGWNASREAARAVADAEPFLDRAERITIVTVDAKPSWSGHGEAPGADIAAHLARRGLKVEVRNVDGMGRDDGSALLEECAAIDADLLVVGGYGRPRLQETIFGGVTQRVAAGAHLPVFLSH